LMFLPAPANWSQPTGIRLTTQSPQILLDVSPSRSDHCDDRNPVKEKLNERERNR
jgi:hypothetical protein